MEFITRKATVQDVETVFYFLKQLAIYEKLEEYLLADVEGLKKTIFEKGFASVLLGCEVENGIETPVCSAVYFYTYSTFLAKPGLYLEDLFVLPDRRRKGYGKKMLKRLVEIGIENGCGRVEWSVLNWNMPAVNFYQQIGAKPQSEWSVYRLTSEAMVNFVGEK